MIATVLLGMACATQDAHDDLKILLEATNQTGEILDDVRGMLIESYDTINNSGLSAEEKAEWLGRLRKVSIPLGRYRRHLKRFEEAVGPAADALELYGELRDLDEQMEEARRTQGNLAAEVLAVGTVMEKLGGYVPVLGKPIEMYGKIARKMADVTGRLSTLVEQTRLQRQVGLAGIHATGEDREKIETLKAFAAGNDLGGGTSLWTPGHPAWVYEPFEHGPILIWNAGSKKWSTVPKGADPTAIYRRMRTAGLRPTPDELLEACKPENRKRLDDLETAARDVLGTFRRMAAQLAGPEEEAFDEVNRAHDRLLSETVHDRRQMSDLTDEFVARFVHAADSRAEIETMALEMLDRLAGESRGPLEAWFASVGGDPAHLTDLSAYRRVALRWSEWSDSEMNAWLAKTGQKKTQTTIHGALGTPAGAGRYRVAGRKVTSDESGESVASRWDMTFSIEELRTLTGLKASELRKHGIDPGP